MNFDWSEDQRTLKAHVRRVLEAECPPAHVHAAQDDPEGRGDPALWRTAAAQGWLATAVPEAHGGLGLGRTALCGLAEELGRACAPIPFASTAYFVTEAILAFGSEAQQAQWLPRLAAGELVGAAALAEGPGPLGARAVEARVEGGRLRAVKAPVVDGRHADLFVVLADDGLHLAPAGPGVTAEPLRAFDPSRPLARVRFEGAPCEPLEGAGGGAGRGVEAAQALLDRAAVFVAFEQLGGAERCLEMARDYALHRHAFGRPIGAYQAIKHKLADIYVANALARANAYYAAWALESGAPELPLAAATARVAASEAFGRAARENIQVHGGVGYTWEADPQLWFRRSRLLAAMAEAPDVWRERLVRQLELRMAA